MKCRGIYVMLHVPSQRWETGIWIGLGEPRGVFNFNIYFFELQQRRGTAGDDTDIPRFQAWLALSAGHVLAFQGCVCPKAGREGRGAPPAPSREEQGWRE